MDMFGYVRVYTWIIAPRIHTYTYDPTVMLGSDFHL